MPAVTPQRTTAAARQDFNRHRGPELEHMFECMLMNFRRVFDRMLESEPPGPAQALRAFVRAACASSMGLSQAQKDKLRHLLQDPLYQEIWVEYFDEACAYDLVEDVAVLTCRLTMAGVWQDFILHGRGNPRHFLRTRNYLLSLTMSGHRAPPVMHHAPHRTC